MIYDNGIRLMLRSLPEHPLSWWNSQKVHRLHQSKMLWSVVHNVVRQLDLLPSKMTKLCASCEYNMLVAAMNPYPCGYYVNPVKA
jgi:hypothetical protein